MLADRRLGALLGFVLSLSVTVVYAEDRHIGYYYPDPQSEETYRAPLPELPGVSRLSRVGFVTQLDQLQKKKPYPPSYHMFAKGTDAQKLIIVATESGRYDTLFRLRGLLASMTADARTSPLFQKLGHVEQLNFFDLLRMAGFKQLTVTNGNDVAHRVYFE
ncbi:MAG: hypothetical protein AAGA53_16920 [Pseudomonadota bacterium]